MKIIKSISISNKEDFKEIYKPGGNSKRFDWNLLKNLQTDKPWFLSGGININNIQEILLDIKPFGIDLSSGVEKELGIKDNGIINNFIRKLKNA